MTGFPSMSANERHTHGWGHLWSRELGRRTFHLPETRAHDWRNRQLVGSSVQSGHMGDTSVLQHG
jgi:hypothetical protein